MQIRMAEVHHDVVYGDSTSNTYDLYIPAIGIKPAPLLIWIHGGAWVSGQKSEFSKLAEKLASEGGVATALLEYRLSLRPPMDSSLLRHPIHVKDCINGLLHILSNNSNLNYNTHSFFLGGHSAGGHIACSIALSGFSFISDDQHSKALSGLKGVFVTEGIFDLKEFSEHNSTYAYNYVQPAFGQESLWKEASPQFTFPCREWKSWALSQSLRFRLIHSTQDTLLSESQSENFKSHLLTIGIENIQFSPLELGDHDEAPQTEYVLRDLIKFIRMD